MTRQRHFTAPATALLVFLFSACSGDGTGPDDEPELVYDRIVVDIPYVNVTHDCDPAWDNPGDFQGGIDIYQNMDPVEGQEGPIASSPRRTLSLNSGEYGLGTIRAEALIARVEARPVVVYGSLVELDNGVEDAGAYFTQTLRWWDARDCWHVDGNCIPATVPTTWTVNVHTRDDVWNPFNSNDEGCRFDVVFRLGVTES
ncbi:MAG: hypothetical protein KFH98_03960 [Gemmatimonadetes bacterium]|nr:hypothetical protein [Gemmatimonadota bacterium]